VPDGAPGCRARARSAVCGGAWTWSAPGRSSGSAARCARGGAAVRLAAALAGAVGLSVVGSRRPCSRACGGACATAVVVVVGEKDRRRHGACTSVVGVPPAGKPRAGGSAGRAAGGRRVRVRDAGGRVRGRPHPVFAAGASRARAAFAVSHSGAWRGGRGVARRGRGPAGGSLASENPGIIRRCGEARPRPLT